MRLLPRSSRSRDALRDAWRHRVPYFHEARFFAVRCQLVFITRTCRYLHSAAWRPASGASALGSPGLFNTVGTYGFGCWARSYSQNTCELIYLLRTLHRCFLLVP